MLNATPLLKAYSQIRSFSLSRRTAASTQEKTLFNLVKKGKNTRFGIDHSFYNIRSVQDYQHAVPLRSYEDFWQNYWQENFPILDNISWPGKIPFFAVSSGTSSGSTKYIPCSHEMVHSNTKAGLDLLVHHINSRKRSQILGGLNFFLGGSTDLKKESDEIWSGDLSGIAAKTVPSWIKSRYFPPPELALISDWREKIESFVVESSKRDIRMIAGVPAWLLIFFDKIRDFKGGLPLAEIFPNLEMVVHGGVRFEPYQRRFESLLEGSRAELREVYPASEGFIAIADRNYGEGLKLNIDHGIFFEFIPVDEISNNNPRRYWIGNVEVGVNYALAITSCAGLWSYLIGDTVRFVDISTPRILITGRTSYFLSDFGEHLTGEEIDASISKAGKAVQRSIVDYSVGSIFPEKEGELGGHLFFVELDKSPIITEEEKVLFRSVLDHQLQERNDDYRAHRADGFGLKEPTIIFLPPNSFERWMESRGKLGGQNKVPRILQKGAIFESLKEFSKY